MHRSYIVTGVVIKFALVHMLFAAVSFLSYESEHITQAGTFLHITELNI